MHKASSFAGKFGESPSSHNPAEVFDVRVPKYLRHKDKYARVILNGREIHLGLYGSPESKANYERVISEWLQTGRKATSILKNGKVGIYRRLQDRQTQQTAFGNQGGNIGLSQKHEGCHGVKTGLFSFGRTGIVRISLLILQYRKINLRNDLRMFPRYYAQISLAYLERISI